GKKPLKEWCSEMNIVQAASIEQVVDGCDCICVLSPDNSERHEDLADLALRSGKPVYIDKTFAPSLAAAKRMFAKAKEYGTPLMSSSALRYAPELEKALTEIDGQAINSVLTVGGGGSFEIYAIHQLEMLVKLLGSGAVRVLQSTNGVSHSMLIDYADQRRGAFNFIPGQGFQITAQYGDLKSIHFDRMTDFFPCFIEAMLEFFDTGICLIPESETLEIAALIEAGTAALRQPGVWVKVPR
ncbi:MAG: Gfo/Idh/MocA family oxidoreductase, partial [Victivallaceae bacterium]|nr:Gfo/Idh/MocA family oxidoreductase [Victivallaceae bacterium]